MRTIQALEVVPVRTGRIDNWPSWAPWAAVAWSLIYAALGIYWAVGGSGFPYTPAAVVDGLGPLLGRFGPGAAWFVVMMAGLPAAALGVLMLRGVRGQLLRPLLISAGGLLTIVLLLLMTGLDMLVRFGYIPYALLSLFTGKPFGLDYLQSLTQWAALHELLCLIGGFLWLGASLYYARRSAGACLYCGRRDVPQGWQSPQQARRWGRVAVYVALVVPTFYALTRYAWALGIPLGMSEAYLHDGQERGIWISGLFLATFGLVGGLLMLGLVNRWGEIFPRWMPGLSRRSVPIPLALIPAALVSVLLIVGGIGIWSSLGGVAAGLRGAGSHSQQLIWEIIIQVGPTLLFPVWGAALGLAALAYYYRRRGPCAVCGRGELFQITQPLAQKAS